MPASFSKILTKIGTKDVQLPGGRLVTVRALRAVELDEVAGVFERPAAPYGVDPTKGSQAPPIQREDDAIYQRRLRRWYTDITCAEICIAIDLEIPFPAGAENAPAVTIALVKPEQRAEWLRAAVVKLREALLESEIRLLRDALFALSTTDLVNEMVKVLFVERADDHKLPENEVRIPENLDLSENGLLLSAAARFHVGDPFVWIDALQPGERAAILANELVKVRTENLDRQLLMASLGIARA